MREDITRQSVLFPDLSKKPLVVKFDQPHSSSDGGLYPKSVADGTKVPPSVLPVTPSLCGCGQMTQAGGVGFIPEAFKAKKPVSLLDWTDRHF